jgi:hypothetical protein
MEQQQLLLELNALKARYRKTQTEKDRILELENLLRIYDEEICEFCNEEINK